MGKCHYFLATDGSQKFEFCAFRSVRQILLSNYRSVVTGHWKGWKTEQGADGKTKFVAQEYENGDECPGFGKRYTLVEYTVSRGCRGGGSGGSSAWCVPPLCSVFSPPCPPPNTHHTHALAPTPHPLRSARRRPRGWSWSLLQSTTCASIA